MERIVVKNVNKTFRIGFKKNESALARVLSFISGVDKGKKIQVLNDVSFKVNSGEIFGIMGSNGSGKSTLLRIIGGIYSFDSGIVKTNGKIISLINLGINLRERLTMKENIFLCCSLFGVSKKNIKMRFKDIVNFSGLDDFVDTKLFQFSSGMLQRLAFSIALYSEPDILLLDEVFEVGDESFRKKSAEKIKGLAGRGASVVLVTHYEEFVRRYCTTYSRMENGKILFKYSLDSKKSRKAI
jgi:ABC-2 type transport system ATP-binding protein